MPYPKREAHVFNSHVIEFQSKRRKPSLSLTLLLLWSTSLNQRLGAPYFFPVLIQPHYFMPHSLFHTFPQRTNLGRRISLLPRLVCTSFLLPLPLLLDLHITLIVANWAEFGPSMLNFDHDFFTIAAVLKYVWSEGAGFLREWRFCDIAASAADRLIDEAHLDRFLKDG